MRRDRPQHPWPFSVPQDELAYRMRADGWTLLELARERQDRGALFNYADFARRNGVFRPTVYRWKARVEQYPQLLEELNAYLNRAKSLLDEDLKAHRISWDEFSAMRGRIGRAPMEAVKHFVQGERVFDAWLRQGGSNGADPDFT